MSAGEIFLTDGLKECTWTLMERQSDPETRENGGAVVTFGRPFWVMSARYDNLSETAFRLLSAWIARRKRSRVTFTAYRPDRPATLLNPAITNSGLGVSAVSIENATVSLTGLGSNVISPGDMISFYTATGGYWVGMATATATPTAGAATVSVWPPPQTPSTSPSPAVRLLQALGEFQLTGEPALSEPSSRVRSVEFTARQVIRT